VVHTAVLYVGLSSPFLIKYEGDNMKPSKFNIFFNLDHTFLIIYNSLYGSLVLIDRESGESLKKGDLFSVLGESENYRKLVDVGVIVEDDFDEDLYLKKMRESMFSRDFIAMFLSLTSRCNLACKYCYQSTRPLIEGGDLTFEKWRFIYNYIVKRVEDGAKVVSIALYGGEPLLNPTMAISITRDLDKLVREYSVKCEATLITNGTIYNENVEEVFDQVNTIQITLDGPREVHNERRPFKSGGGSFDTIFNNLLRIVDRHGKKTGLRVNVDEYNVNSTRDFIDMLVEYGLQSKIIAIDLSPVHPDQATKYTPFKTSRNYYEYYVNISRRIVELLEYAVEKGFKITKVFIKGPCLCMFKYGYGVDEELNIYLCPGFMYDTPIGYFNNNDVTLTSRIKDEITTRDPQCIYNCKYGPMCYGGCIYLKSKGAPTCLRMLYGDEYLERLVRAYVFSRYREVIERARSSSC